MPPDLAGDVALLEEQVEAVELLIQSEDASSQDLQGHLRAMYGDVAVGAGSQRRYPPGKGGDGDVAELVTERVGGTEAEVADPLANLRYDARSIAPRSRPRMARR